MSYNKLRLQTKRTTALFIIKLKTKLPNQTTVNPCLLSSPLVYHDLPSSPLVYHGLPWSTMVSFGLLWSTMVYQLVILLIILYNVTYYHVTSICTLSII